MSLMLYKELDWELFQKQTTAPSPAVLGHMGLGRCGPRSQPVSVSSLLSHPPPTPSQDTEDLDHYEMKEEEPAEGKKSEDDGIGKENLAILEKIKKNQRQDYLNVRTCSGGLGPGLGGHWLGGGRPLPASLGAAFSGGLGVPNPCLNPERAARLPLRCRAHDRECSRPPCRGRCQARYRPLTGS